MNQKESEGERKESKVKINQIELLELIHTWKNTKLEREREEKSKTIEARYFLKQYNRQTNNE